MKRSQKIDLCVIFGLFYVFLLLQFDKVNIYYDDWGYLSLSYGYTMPEVVGANFDLKHLLEFMKVHYQVANGRLFSLTIFPLLFMLGGVKLLQISMATVVLLIFVLIFGLTYKMADISSDLHSRWKIDVLAIFVCLLYGLIDISFHRFGTYWYAASFSYVMPVILYLIFAILYYKVTVSEGKANIIYIIFTILLGFACCCSQEQWIAAVGSYIFCIILYKYYTRKKVKIWDWAIIVASILGAMPILTSPAIKNRLSNNNEFVENGFINRTIENIFAICRIFFDKYNSKYIFAFLFFMLILGIYMWVKKIGNRLWNIIFCFCTIGIAYLYKINLTNKVVICMFFIYILIVSVQLVFFLFANNNVLQGILYIGAFCSVACLVIVPELPLRVVLPYMYISFSIFSYVFWKIIMENIEFVSILILVLIAKYSITNLRITYKGYVKNDWIFNYNDAEIRKNVTNIYAGKNVDVIYLYKQIDILYGGEMPYVEGFEKILVWMYEYYDIPESVTIEYKEIDDAVLKSTLNYRG